jgi:hypothetical protein
MGLGVAFGRDSWQSPIAFIRMPRPVRMPIGRDFSNSDIATGAAINNPIATDSTLRIDSLHKIRFNLANAALYLSLDGKVRIVTQKFSRATESCSQQLPAANPRRLTTQPGG